MPPHPDRQISRIRLSDKTSRLRFRVQRRLQFLNTLSQADAEKRVAEVTTQVKSDLDKARKNAMQLAFWLTIPLFIGALSASLAATEGGGLRDGTWGNKAPRR